MASNRRRRPAPNILAFLNFEDLVTDAALDDIFFAPSERNSVTGLSVPSRHPLHRDFAPAQNSATGLLAQPSKLQAFDLEGLARTQQDRVTAHWLVVRDHMLYRHWAADLNFQGAYKTFERLRRRRQSPEGYRHEYAEFRFLRVAMRYLVTFSSNRVQRLPSAKERRSIIGHIDALLMDMDKRGGGFDDYARNLQLMTTLTDLKAKIGARARKPRHDEAKPFRDFDVSLARSLIATFGSASPVIVEQLARAVGSTLDQRTIESHVELAKNEGNRL